MSRKKISDLTKRQIYRRADHLCEYCHASEKWQYVRFTVDHIVPVSLGGSDDLGNLALACFHCNRRKWNHIKATDPESGQRVELFNPRLSLWSEHFIWSGDRLSVVGLTSTGAATIVVLDLNRERVVLICAADIEIGRHPPGSDPIQK